MTAVPEGAIEVVLYTRPDCCLCHDARDVLLQVQARHPFQLLERNIDEDPDLVRLYGTEIPVVTVAGRKAFKYRVDRRKLERVLDHARASSR